MEIDNRTQDENISEADEMALINSLNPKQKDKYNKDAVYRQQMRNGFKTKADYGALENIANNSPEQLPHNEIIQDTLKGPVENNRFGVAVNTGVGSVEGGDKALGERMEALKSDEPTTIAEQERPENSNKSIEDIIANSKQNYGLVDDYYGNSMSEMWKNLSPEDRKILVLDQLGTSLKNISKARLPMYSAYGKSYEGEGVGDEKSMLQKGIQESFKAGLDRRNSRLNTQMDNLLKQANFPANLSMQLKTMWESGDLNNRQKVNFIRLMSDVDFMDAMKAGVVSIAANGQILNQAGSVIGSLL